MRKMFLSMVLLASASTVFAGPFVSGGTPGHLQCKDSKQIYQIEFVYLGKSVSLTGVQNFSQGPRALDFECEGVYQAVPSAIDTLLMFTCRSNINSDKINIYRRKGTSQYSGQLMTKTRNGVVKPVGLNCKFGS